MFRWIDTKTSSYNAIEYLKRIRSAGDSTLLFVRDFVDPYLESADGVMFGKLYPNTACAVLQVALYLSLIAFLATLICLAACTFGKRHKTFEIIRTFSMMFSFCTGPMSQLFITDSILAAPAVYGIYIVIVFVIDRCLDSWEERQELIRESRDKAREKKNRLAFAGKYSRLYYKLMQKNFMSNRRDSLMVALSTMIASSFLFAGMGLRDVFNRGFGQDMSMVGGEGLISVIRSFVIVLVIISLVLMSLSFSHYWHQRVKSYGVFLMLGIRRKSLHRFMEAEVVICTGLSTLVGMGLGHIYVALWKLYVARTMPELEVGSGFGALSYVLTILIMIALIWFSYHFGKQQYDIQRTVDTRGLAARGEHVPGRSRWLFMAIGAALVVVSAIGFCRRKSGENLIVYACLCGGLYFLILGGWSAYLREARSTRAGYIRTFIDHYIVRYRYRSMVKYISALTLLFISVNFYFMLPVASNLISQDVAGLYPYDYVCLSNGDEEARLNEIAEEIDADVTMIPMMRVTAFENTENPLFYGDGSHSYFQGQNIGISETSYSLLKSKAEAANREAGDSDAGAKTDYEFTELDADGTSIYIVYQQDRGTRSKPIDWTPTAMRPHIRIGTRQRYAELSDYPPLKVAGQEVSSLIGAFRQGDFENLVVFSDEYMATVQDTADGPQRLWLMKVPAANRAKADGLLAEYARNHVAAEKSEEYQDDRVSCVYSKAETVKQQSTSKMLQIIVNIFILIVLASMSVFIVSAKVISEIEDTAGRYEFMERFGMRKKDRIKHLSREVGRLVYMPTAIGLVTAPIMTWIVLRLRDYSLSDMVSYAGVALVIMAIYIGVQLLLYAAMRSYSIKRIERN